MELFSYLPFLVLIFLYPYVTCTAINFYGIEIAPHAQIVKVSVHTSPFLQITDKASVRHHNVNPKHFHQSVDGKDYSSILARLATRPARRERAISTSNYKPRRRARRGEWMTLSICAWQWHFGSGTSYHIHAARKYTRTLSRNSNMKEILICPHRPFKKLAEQMRSIFITNLQRRT